MPLPGLVCDQTVWQQQLAALSGVAQCICMDWGTLDSLTSMAEKVLREAPERFSLAGHSMGGRVAMEVYRLAPRRVRRIALLDTGWAPLPEGVRGEEEARNRNALLAIAQSQGMRAMAEKWLPPMIAASRWNDAPLVEAILQMFARKTAGIFAAQIRALLARSDARSVLREIRCPALVLTGEQDSWSPPRNHEEMAAAIAGSQLVLVPGSGHMSTMEQPAAVTQAMGVWLERAK